MDERKRMQRRIVLAGLGALSGLLVGLGAAIILTQGGHVRIDLEVGFPFVAIIIGAVVGFLDLPKTGNRILAAGIALVTLALGGFSVIPPRQWSGPLQRRGLHRRNDDEPFRHLGGASAGHQSRLYQ